MLPAPSVGRFDSAVNYSGLFRQWQRRTYGVQAKLPTRACGCGQGSIMGNHVCSIHVMRVCDCHISGPQA